MRFSTIFTAALAFGYVAAQANPTQQILLAFKEITTLSSDLRIQVQGINLITAIVKGPIIAQGFIKIAARVGKATTMISGGNSAKTKRQLAPLAAPDAKLVVQSLTTFVRVHQALLNVVIGKHGLLTLVPFFGPIRRALVSLEAAIDTFAFYLIALIPTEESAAKEQFGSLGVTVTIAIETFGRPL